MNQVAPWISVSEFPTLPDGLTVDDGEKAECILAASGILYRLSGHKWPGVLTDTIRPGATGCCGSARRGCHRLSELKLPGYPVLAVTEVLVDGLTVPEDRYRLDDGRFLVWIPQDDLVDGLEDRNGWPCCQRMDRDTTEDDTFQVVYTWGGLPDAGGLRAVRTLSYELALATRPKSGCRLPSRVQNVTRQGVSYVLLDTMGDLFDKGRVGLTEVDMWLSSVQVGHRRRPGAVVDPHEVAMRGRAVRRTDWNPSS